MSSLLSSYSHSRPQMRTEGFEVVTSPMGKGTPVTLANFYPVRSASASLASNRKVLPRPVSSTAITPTTVIGSSVIQADRIVELRDDKVFTSHRPARLPTSASNNTPSQEPNDDGQTNESFSTVASTADPVTELRSINPVAGPHCRPGSESGSRLASVSGSIPRRSLGPRELSMNDLKFRAQQEASSRPISRGLDLFSQAYASHASNKRSASADGAVRAAPSLIQQYATTTLRPHTGLAGKAQPQTLSSLLAVSPASASALNASFVSVANSSDSDGGVGRTGGKKEDALAVSLSSTANGIPIVETDIPKSFGYFSAAKASDGPESPDLRRLRSLRLQRKESQSAIKLPSAEQTPLSGEGHSQVEDSLRRIESKGVFSNLLRQRESFITPNVLPGLPDDSIADNSKQSHMLERSGIARRVREFEDEAEGDAKLEEDFWSRASKHQGIRTRLIDRSYREIEERIDYDRMRRLDSPTSGQSRRFLSSAGSGGPSAHAASDLTVADFKIVTRDANNSLRPMPTLPKNFQVCAPDFDDQTGHRLWKLEDKANIALPGTEAECGYGKMTHPGSSPSRPPTTDNSLPSGNRSCTELASPYTNTSAGKPPRPALIRDTDMIMGMAKVDANQSLANSQQLFRINASATGGPSSVHFRPSSGDLLTRQYQLRAIASAEARAVQITNPEPIAKRLSISTVASTGPVTPSYTPRVMDGLATPPSGSLLKPFLTPILTAQPGPTKSVPTIQTPDTVDRSSLQVKEMQRRLRRAVETEDKRMHVIQKELDTLDTSAASHALVTGSPTPMIPTFSPTSAKLLHLDDLDANTTVTSAFASAMNNSVEAARDGSLVWHFEAERIRQQSRAAARGKRAEASDSYGTVAEEEEDEGWTAVASLKESTGWQEAMGKGTGTRHHQPSITNLPSDHLHNLNYYQYQQRMQQQQAAEAKGGPKQRESQKLRSKIERLERTSKTEVPNITIQFYNVTGMGDSVSDKNENTTRGRSGDTPLVGALAGAHQGSIRTAKYKRGQSPDAAASLSLDGIATRTGSVEEAEELPALTGLKACSSILHKQKLQPLSSESSSSTIVSPKPQGAFNKAQIGSNSTVNTDMTVQETIASKEYPTLNFSTAGRVTSELETFMPPQELHLYQMYCANTDVIIMLRPISSAAPSMYAGNFFVPHDYCDDDGIPLPVHEIKEDLDFDQVMRFTTSTCRIKGKGIGVSLKSSPYPPIEGFIPINPSLSKTYSEARRKERLLEDNLMRAGGNNNASDKLSMNLLAKIRAQHSMFGAATSVAMREIEHSLQVSKTKLMEMVAKYNEESAFTVDKLSVSEKYIDQMNEAQFLGKTAATWRGTDLYYRQLGSELEVERFNDGVPIFYARKGDLLYTYDPKTNELKKGADSVLKFTDPSSTFRKVEILTHRSFIISEESKRIIKDPGRAFIIGPDFDGFSYSHSLPKTLMEDPAGYMDYCNSRINIKNVPSMGLVSPLDVEHILEARALTQWKQNHGYECQNTIKTQEITDGSHVAILPNMEVRCLHNFIDILRFYRECWLRGYPQLLNPNWKVVLCNETKMPVPFGDEISLPIVDDCGMALVVHSISAEGKQYDAVKAEALRLTKGMEEQIAIKKGVAPVGARVHPRPMLFSGNVVMQLATALAKKALAEKFYALRRWLLMPPCFMTNKRVVVSEHIFNLIALPPVGHADDLRGKGSPRTHRDIQALMVDQGLDLGDSVFGTNPENSISADGEMESLSSNSANASLAGMRAMHLTVPISEEFEILREQKLGALLADFEESCSDFDGCFIDDCGRFTKMLKQFVEYQTIGDPTSGAAASALQGNGEALSVIIEDEVVLVKALTATNSVNNQHQGAQKRVSASPMNGSLTISPPSNGLDSTTNAPLRGRLNSGRSSSIISVDPAGSSKQAPMTSGAFYQSMQGLMSRTMSNMSDTQQPMIGSSNSTTPQRSRRSSFTANSFLFVPQTKQSDFEGHRTAHQPATPKAK